MQFNKHRIKFILLYEKIYHFPSKITFITNILLTTTARICDPNLKKQRNRFLFSPFQKCNKLSLASPRTLTEMRIVEKRKKQM